MANKNKNEGTKHTKEDIINEVLKLLKKNKEWEQRFKGYIEKVNDVLANQDAKYKTFRTPNQLSRYSSVSVRDGKTYDLRYEGQSVANVRCTRKRILLEPNKTNASKFGFNFNNSEKTSKKVEWEWSYKRASEFRSHFKNYAEKCGNNTQPEHRLENRLLNFFSSNEKPFSIKVVTLYESYFQMPTPLKASDHGELPTYTTHKNRRGGGIDIMARVTPKNRAKGEGSRLCVIELKDKNEENESQSDAMGQAIAYAVFIANLLRGDSGQEWFNFFMKSSKRVLPPQLHIDVVTIMPDGNTEEFCDKELNVPRLDTTLHCHTLYYYDDEFAQGKGSIVFNPKKSTYLNEVILKEAT